MFYQRFKLYAKFILILNPPFFQIIKFQRQENTNLKKIFANMKLKLQYTQEALARERIESENSQIALKKVLYRLFFLCFNKIISIEIEVK